MPLRKLQEIIVDYAQHLYKEGRFRALQFSVDYPYKGPAFAFTLKGDHLAFSDNTQVSVTSQDGRGITEKVDHDCFRKPRRNQVKAAFLKFQYWENKILNKLDHADPDNRERELEIITGKLLPFAVAILKSTAESYALLEPSLDTRPDSWTHLACDLICRPGMLESGESVPAEIQVKAEEFNDLLREAQRRIRRARAIESQSALSKSPDASGKIVRLLKEIILDCAGEMVLAGQRKDTGPSPVSLGSLQYPPEPVMKDGTNSSPVAGSPSQDSKGNPVILKTKIRTPENAEAPSRDEDTNPQSNRRKGRTNLRKARTTQGSLLIASERRKAVEAYIAEVFEKTGKRITRADIWKSARYKDRTDFERWQRNDPKSTRTANERFTRVLKEKPHLK